MDVKVVYTGGKRFEAFARSHQVISDQPLDDDGSDKGMTPSELFLASLGSCAGYYATEYLMARGLRTDGLEVRVSGLKEGKPVRIASIHVEVTAPGLEAADARHRDGIRHAVDACLIHNTLLIPTQVDIHVASQVEEHALA